MINLILLRFMVCTHQQDWIKRHSLITGNMECMDLYFIGFHALCHQQAHFIRHLS